MNHEYCDFNIESLIKMKENGTIFHTAAGRKVLKIAEIDSVAGTLRMERSTGKITWSLSIDKLIDVHKKIHTGEIDLNHYEIDKEIPTWGNYVTGLLNYFKCSKDH